MGRLCVFTEGDLEGQYGILSEDGKERYYYPLDEEHVANWVTGESPETLEVPADSEFRYLKVEDLPAEYQQDDYLEYIEAVSEADSEEQPEEEEEEEDEGDEDSDDIDEGFEEGDE